MINWKLTWPGWQTQPKTARSNLKKQLVTSRNTTRFSNWWTANSKRQRQKNKGQTKSAWTSKTASINWYSKFPSWRTRCNQIQCFVNRPISSIRMHRICIITCQKGNQLFKKQVNSWRECKMNSIYKASSNITDSKLFNKLWIKSSQTNKTTSRVVNLLNRLSKLNCSPSNLSQFLSRSHFQCPETSSSENKQPAKFNSIALN